MKQVAEDRLCISANGFTRAIKHDDTQTRIVDVDCAFRQQGRREGRDQRIGVGSEAEQAIL